MTDEEGDGVGGEGEARTADWRKRAGPRIKPTAREREAHEATHTCRSAIGAHTVSPRVEDKK